MRGFLSIRRDSYSRVDNCERISINSKRQLLKVGHLWEDFYQFEVTVTQGWPFVRGFLSIRSESYSRVDTCERISINSKWQLLKGGHLWEDFYQFEVESYSRVDTCERISINSKWQLLKRGHLWKDFYQFEVTVTQGWTIVRGFLSIRRDSYSRVDTCERISINSKWQLLKGGQLWEDLYQFEVTVTQGWTLVRGFLSIRSDSYCKGGHLWEEFLLIRSDSYSKVATCERISINSKRQLLKGGHLWVDFYQFEVTVTQEWTLVKGFLSIRSDSYSRVDTCERISINSKWQLLKGGHLWEDFYQFEVTVTQGWSKWQLLKGGHLWEDFYQFEATVTQGWTVVRGFLSIRSDSYSRVDTCERISINSKWQLLKGGHLWEDFYQFEVTVTQGWPLVRGFLSIRSSSYSRVDTCERISINSKWQLLKGSHLWEDFYQFEGSSYSRVDTCERISINSKRQLLKGGHLWEDFYQFEVTVTQGWPFVRGFLSIRSESYSRVDTSERISINSKWQLLKGGHLWEDFYQFEVDSYSRVDTCERISINSKWQLLKERTLVKGFLSIRRDSYWKGGQLWEDFYQFEGTVTQGWTLVRGFLSIRSDSYSRVDSCERISINSKWQLLKGGHLWEDFYQFEVTVTERVATCERISINSKGQLCQGWPLVRGISINSKWQLLKGGHLWEDFYQFEEAVTQEWTLMKGFLSIRSDSYSRVDSCERISINSKWQFLKGGRSDSYSRVDTCERISINSKWQLLKGGHLWEDFYQFEVTVNESLATCERISINSKRQLLKSGQVVRGFLSILSDSYSRVDTCERISINSKWQLLKGGHLWEDFYQFEVTVTQGWPLVRGFLSIRSRQLLKGGHLWEDFYQFEVTVTQGWPFVRGFLSIRSESYSRVDTCERISINSKW